MTSDRPTVSPSAILCADWGKENRKRVVYVADVSARVVRRVDASAWSLGAVLAETERWARTGPVLATFDLPLGVPESYLAGARRVPVWRSSSTFIEFLTYAYSMPQFFRSTSRASDWKIEQPFFSVPAGTGGLTSYRSAASQQGINLYRDIDTVTRAKTLFATSGIPGSVGSAACALWHELGPWLSTNRAFKVWPFEGDLDVLLQTAPVVIGEIYPRAAYATALLDGSAASRAPLAVAKTDANVRREAIATLQAAEWVRQLGVTIANLTEAQANEDDFDACMTAAALLRCTLVKLPLCPPTIPSSREEGGILGTGSVDFALAEQTFGKVSRGRVLRERGNREAHADVAEGARTFRCPIPGCDKVYTNARGGWDAHVG